jgi:hypothetical protein
MKDINNNNNMDNNQNKEVKFAPGVELPQLTGKLVFQFDEESPIEIANVFDKKEVYLSLNQEQNSKITFEGENGRVMKLFIEPVKKPGMKVVEDTPSANGKK